MLRIWITGLPEQIREKLLKADGVLTTAAGQFQHGSRGGQQLAQQIPDGLTIAFRGWKKKPFVHRYSLQGAALWLQWRRSSASQASSAARASGCSR